MKKSSAKKNGDVNLSLFGSVLDSTHECVFIFNKWAMNQSSIILEALQVVEPYYLITLIVVGIVGNFFSFYIFRFTKLK